MCFMIMNESLRAFFMKMNLSIELYSPKGFPNYHSLSISSGNFPRRCNLLRRNNPRAKLSCNLPGRVSISPCLDRMPRLTTCFLAMSITWLITCVMIKSFIDQLAWSKFHDKNDNCKTKSN